LEDEKAGYVKKISILVPSYNEEKNIVLLYNEIVKMFTNCLPAYDYEILFIDNHSTDSTRSLLREICTENKKVRCIFNARNFGPVKSPYYGLCQTSGDCAVMLYADFQEPVDLIPVFVQEWEKNYKIVIGIKAKSKENPMMRLFRTMYYKLFKKLSDEIEQIEHFDGFGLYDRSFIDVLRNLHEPLPYLKNLVAELSFNRKDIPYTQQKRRFGKSHVSWYRLYNDAMLGFTSYTKVGLRVATIMGFIFSFFSFVTALVYFVLKLVNWDSFSTGIAPLVIGVFFLGSMQLFFIGFIGEYVMAINSRVMDRPLVIEEERINF
jgi:glycosyltransferase involved in cell wall biosynthesis